MSSLSGIMDVSFMRCPASSDNLRYVYQLQASSRLLANAAHSASVRGWTSKFGHQMTRFILLTLVFACFQFCADAQDRERHYNDEEVGKICIDACTFVDMKSEGCVIACFMAGQQIDRGELVSEANSSEISKASGTCRPSSATERIPGGQGTWAVWDPVAGLHVNTFVRDSNGPVRQDEAAQWLKRECKDAGGTHCYNIGGCSVGIGLAAPEDNSWVFVGCSSSVDGSWDDHYRQAVNICEARTGCECHSCEGRSCTSN